jgi:uncharacterized protein
MCRMKKGHRAEPKDGFRRMLLTVHHHLAGKGTSMLHIFIFCALFPLIVNAQSAGFDCNRTTTPVEKTICTDSHLSCLDYLLLRYYKQALDISSKPQTLRDTQRKWLTGARNKCLDLACLSNAYNERLAILKSSLLSDVKHSADFSGLYENSHGEILVHQISSSKIKFDLSVIGPYDKNKIFSPKNNEVEDEALLVGDTAIYNEDEDCSIVFVFSNHNVSITEYGCWIYAASATGIYKLKSKHIK